MEYVIDSLLLLQSQIKKQFRSPPHYVLHILSLGTLLKGDKQTCSFFQRCPGNALCILQYYDYTYVMLYLFYLKSPSIPLLHLSPSPHLQRKVRRFLQISLHRCFQLFPIQLVLDQLAGPL